MPLEACHALGDDTFASPDLSPFCIRCRQRIAFRFCHTAFVARSWDRHDEKERARRASI